MSQINNDLLKVSFAFEAVDHCPICTGRVMIPNGKIRWLEIDFWYVICPACGLKYMNPRPTRESYREFYKNLFWQQKIRNMGFHEFGQVWQGGKHKWDNDGKWEPEFGIKNISEKIKALRIETISSSLSENISLDSQAHILEIGCAFPVTLQYLKEKFNCHIYAIEPSEEARRIIKENHNINLIGYNAEEVEDIKRQGVKFDAVIFSHVLENTTDPLQVIKDTSNCLNDNGVIYIQTPNLLVCDQMNPYHPYVFSVNSLMLIAEKAGMEYVQISKTIERMLTVILKKC